MLLVWQTLSNGLPSRSQNMHHQVRLNKYTKRAGSSPLPPLPEEDEDGDLDWVGKHARS